MIITLLQAITISFSLKSLASFIGEMIVMNIENNYDKAVQISLYLISYLLSCSKCFSFWFTLVLTADLFIAALTSLLISIIEWILEQIFKKNIT